MDLSCWGGGGGLGGDMSSLSSLQHPEPDSLTSKEMRQKLRYILGQNQKTRTIFNGSSFNCLLCAFIFSKRQRSAQEFFLGIDLSSKQALFCCLKIKFSLQSVVLWLFLSQ
jgi:hypothetical protein